MKTLTKTFKVSFRLQKTANKTHPIQVMLALGTKDGDKYLRVIHACGITLKESEWNASKSRPTDVATFQKMMALEHAIYQEMEGFKQYSEENIIRHFHEGTFKQILVDNVNEIIHNHSSRAEAFHQQMLMTSPHYTAVQHYVSKMKDNNYRIVDANGRAISIEEFFDPKLPGSTGSTPENTMPTFSTITSIPSSPAIKTNQPIIQGEEAKYTLPSDCVLFSDFIRLVGKDKIEERELTSDAKDEKYITLANKLKLWNEKLTLAEYTDKIGTQFTKWLKENSKTKNTLGNYITTLKAVLTHAQVKYKILTHVVTRDSIYAKVQEEVKQPYLNFQQLEVLQNMELAGDLKIARDLAIISAHTGGSRYSDWNQYFQLQTEVINGKKVHVIERMNSKTGTGTTIPVQPFIVDIIKKYNGSLPEIEEGTFNENIREVCRLAGKIDTSFLHDYVYKRWDFKTEKPETVKIEDENGNLVVPKLYQLIGSHTFRRSFCTNYVNILDADTLREFSDQSLKTFNSYVKSNNKDKMKKFINTVPGFN